VAYQRFPKGDDRDFSSGRVLFNKPGNPNFPVRLAGELFGHCLEHSNKTKDICVYDPCCGIASLLTILGFLFNEKIAAIRGSDIDREAIDFAERNLSLLSTAGIEKRKNDLTDLAKKYNRQSHVDALDSLENLAGHIKHGITTELFVADILDRDSLKNRDFCADIVIADVPYGDLAAWSGGGAGRINTLLDTLVPVIGRDTVVAIIRDKNQKPDNHRYGRVEKFKAGRRTVELFKLQ
jgi:hypothetical protein